MSFLKIFLGVVVALAQTGVGVGLGKVEINEPLAPGGIYRLPDLPVINTGEVGGTYQVRATDVSHPAGVETDGWLRFRPQTFPLEPEQSRLVKVTLTLPFDALEGDYLVYLEASPVQNPQKGVAIGPAAATKLYFSVKSGAVLGALRTRIITFILSRPEIYLLLAALLLLEALFIIRRHYHFHIEARTKT